ncbi:MAG: hypothetical protein HQL60_07885 [Magnetococcales bacterium]|nr:hypothetical protein [Magnetococcales bacterium]
MTDQEHKVGQVHDHFCRAVVSDPEKAAGLIQEQLPMQISSCLSSELPTNVTLPTPSPIQSVFGDDAQVAH